MHQEPYRKYRAPSGYLNDRTCWPLDLDYIERHIGRWAVAIVRGGADRMLIETEMYESDQTNYPGACVCDDCIATYLKTFAQGWQILYEQVPAERCGLWLTANDASGTMAGSRASASWRCTTRSESDARRSTRRSSLATHPA